MKILCISASLFCLVCCAGCLSDSRENGVSLSGGNCKTSEYISRQVREVSFLELLCGLSGLCVRRTDRFCNWLSDEEPCTVNSSEEQIPLISFSDACLTPLAYSNQLIRCKGVLKKIKYGPLIMRPVSGELHDDEHLVHAGTYLDIGVNMRDGEPGPDSDVYGKNVVVEGFLAVVPYPDLPYLDFPYHTELLDCRIVPEGADDNERRILPAEKLNAGVGFCYRSPCDEFRLVARLETGAYYIVHYYSAKLWMAYVMNEKTSGLQRILAVTRPMPLFPGKKKNEGRQKLVWSYLERLKSLVQISDGTSCCEDGYCRANSYSNIKTTKIDVASESELARFLGDFLKIVNAPEDSE